MKNCICCGKGLNRHRDLFCPRCVSNRSMEARLKALIKVHKIYFRPKPNYKFVL